MNERVAQSTPFMVDTEAGVRAMVEAIEDEKESAIVPPWPWLPAGLAMRHLPMSVLRRVPVVQKFV
jgi:hypothetical protein